MSVLAPLLITALITWSPAGTVPDTGGLQVVVDSDGGADDAMAILLLLSKQSKARVLAFTSVRGNTGVENVTSNLLLIQQVAKRELPVYMGSPQGLVYEEKASDNYGYDGIGDVFVKPPISLKKDGHAALALVNLVQKNPGNVTVLCIGPLTNLALAMHLYPKFLSEVKDVVILGGSYKGGGNVRPGVEFNRYMDPEAAEFVFANIPSTKLVTLLPLETFNGNSYPMSWRLRDLGNIDSGFIRFLNKAERLGIQKMGDVWTTGDPLAAGVLLDPLLVTKTMTARVVVETEGHLARGAMFLDQEGTAHNVRIVTGVDGVRFQAMLLSYLAG